MRDRCRLRFVRRQHECILVARETRVDRLNLQIRQDEIKDVARGAVRVQQSEETKVPEYRGIYGRSGQPN
jgi:hypothetical protein